MAELDVACVTVEAEQTRQKDAERLTTEYAVLRGQLPDYEKRA